MAVPSIYGDISTNGNDPVFYGEIPGSVHYGIQGPPGPAGKDYVLTDADKEEIAEMAAELVDVPDSGGNVDFRTDETLKLENGILSVNTTNDVEQDNTLPITSAGVFSVVGNIEALLKTI